MSAGRVLTHAPGSATWTTTAGRLSSTSGSTVMLTAPGIAQRVTVTAGAASIAFTIVAPTGVFMDRHASAATLVKHNVGQPDSGIMVLPYLLPDTVNFYNVIYRELDVAGTGTGVYSCNPARGGHCGAGGGGAPCPDLTVTNTVVAGKGTQTARGDCAYSGHCGTSPPYAAGSVTLDIPYEYKVGSGAYFRFATVHQEHTLAGDGSTLTSMKVGATGSTTVAAPTQAIPGC